MVPYMCHLSVLGMVLFQEPLLRECILQGSRNTLLLSNSHHLLASFFPDPYDDAIPGAVCSRIDDQRVFIELILVASPLSSGENHLSYLSVFVP